MPERRDVVVLGGSAGSVEALFRILRDLPETPAAAMAVVLHRHPSMASSLSGVFNAHSRVPVIEPRGGERFEPGIVFLAPQDRHMTVHGGRMHLNREPRQHHTRPAIDPLFRSVADVYGPRVIGILLSGNLSDGVGGLIQIKQRQGISLVQDPREAPFPSMPTNALIYDNVDAVVRVDFLWELTSRLIHGEDVHDLVEAHEVHRARAEGLRRVRGRGR